MKAFSRIRSILVASSGVSVILEIRYISLSLYVPSAGKEEAVALVSPFSVEFTVGALLTCFCFAMTGSSLLMGSNFLVPLSLAPAFISVSGFLVSFSLGLGGVEGVPGVGDVEGVPGVGDVEEVPEVGDVEEVPGVGDVEEVPEDGC